MARASHEHRNPFVRSLQRALVADGRAEVEVALRIAALRSRNLGCAEIAQQLSVSEDAIRRADALLERCRAGPARGRF